MKYAQIIKTNLIDNKDLILVERSLDSDTWYCGYLPYTGTVMQDPEFTNQGTSPNGLDLMHFDDASLGLQGWYYIWDYPNLEILIDIIKDDLVLIDNYNKHSSKSREDMIRNYLKVGNTKMALSYVEDDIDDLEYYVDSNFVTYIGDYIIFTFPSFKAVVFKDEVKAFEV